LGNIESPTGAEGPAGHFVYDWLTRNGFAAKKYALTEQRFNVAALLEGSGGGYNLIFNSHLDTTLRADAVWSAVDPNEALYRSAWIDKDEIVGDAVVNDRGPMAAFLIAAKAIRDAGYPLKGDLTVSAAAGEGSTLVPRQSADGSTLGPRDHHRGCCWRRQRDAGPWKDGRSGPVHPPAWTVDPVPVYLSRPADL
jgi:hypothetical protein